MGPLFEREERRCVAQGWPKAKHPPCSTHAKHIPSSITTSSSSSSSTLTPFYFGERLAHRPLIPLALAVWASVLITCVARRGETLSFCPVTRNPQESAPKIHTAPHLYFYSVPFVFLYSWVMNSAGWWWSVVRQILLGSVDQRWSAGAQAHLAGIARNKLQPEAFISLIALGW